MCKTCFTECNAGYYGNGSATCTLCPGNTIKSSPGYASDCNTDAQCDGVSNEPNTGHTVCGRSSVISPLTEKLNKWK